MDPFQYFKTIKLVLSAMISRGLGICLKVPTCFMMSMFMLLVHAWNSNPTVTYPPPVYSIAYQ